MKKFDIDHKSRVVYETTNQNPMWFGEIFYSAGRNYFKDSLRHFSNDSWSLNKESLDNLYDYIVRNPDKYDIGFVGDVSPLMTNEDRNDYMAETYKIESQGIISFMYKPLFDSGRDYFSQYPKNIVSILSPKESGVQNLMKFTGLMDEIAKYKN
ncbi:MAG: hypothetical protein ABEI74_02090 [Candidatus Pacearchaeota archaeon]